MGKKIEKLSDVADVDIAEAGCFKYVLIEVRERTATGAGQSKLVVRGDASCAYHGKTNRKFFIKTFVTSSNFNRLADVLDLLENEIEPSKLILDCKGGGRIRVDPRTRTISVYGYSQVKFF